jgi:hypothetical protein
VLEQHLTDAEAKPDAASSTLTDPRPDAPKDKAMRRRRKKVPVSDQVPQHVNAAFCRTFS